MATYISIDDSGNITYQIDGEDKQTMLPNLGMAAIQAEITRIIETLTTYRGQPVVVSQAADMTDDLVIYLYTGDEEGYNADHWYYYDQETETWTDGGEYVANPVSIDPTLTKAGEAADAKATGDAIAGVSADLTAAINTGLDGKADIITETLSGSVVSFGDGADDVPVKDLTVGIAPVQSGSGEPSPDNVRPITGWTGANVARTGINLANTSEWFSGVPYNPNVGSTMPTLTKQTDVSVSSDGTVSFTSLGSWFGRSCRVLVKPNTKYYLKCSVSGGSNFAVGWVIADKNGTVLSKTGYYAVSGFYDVDSNPLTTPDNAYYLYLQFIERASGTRTITISGLRVILGETDKSFEPYKGNIVNIDWQTEAGTVYGGSLDVTTGVLTVDWLGYECSEVGGDWTISDSGYSDETNSYWASIARTIPKPYADTPNYGDEYGKFNYGKWRYKAESGKWRAYNVKSQNSLRIIILSDTDFRTVSAMNTFLASLAEPLQVVLKIEQPVTYQLTPTEVKTLLGVNNIWADTGDVRVEYAADTKMYVDENAASLEGTVFNIIAPTEKSSIASRNYAENRLFILNNVLYKVVSAIASGETITPGTNCTAATLDDVIAELRALIAAIE